MPIVLFLVFLLGMIFAIGTSYLSDFNKYSLGFKINGEILNDFLYCVIGIGMVEELVKFIPVLLVIPFIRKTLEPIDYLIIASVSALGFAFLENMIYFESGGIKTMQGRALTANVTHMFNSSLIAYGWVIGVFSKKKWVFLRTLVYFIIASLAHGFYDFWLVNNSVSAFNFMTFVWLLMSMLIWVSMLNNCINNSSSIQVKWRFHPKKLNNFLLFALSGVFLLEYIIVGVEYGASVANDELQKDIVSGSFLLIFLTFSLSRFDYIPNYWAPLRFWDWNIIFNMPNMTAKHFDWYSVLNQKVILSPFGNSGTLDGQLPVTGEILKRELVSYDKNWFLVKLDSPIQWGFKKVEFVLIKPLKDNEMLLDQKLQIVKVRLVKNVDNLSKKVKRKRDFLLVDHVHVQKK
jgi:RsiW-degrading membrane proteinase PrsW (M82 family)